MLKNREKLVFAELLVNGRKPDKHIAHDRKISQPTVTRIRQKLENEGYIEEYYAKPSFQKMDLNIFVVTTFTWNDYSKKEVVAQAIKDIVSNPKVMFLARGNGFSGKTGIIFSLHKDLSSYEDFLVALKAKWGRYMDEVDQFISSSSNIFKSFKYHHAVLELMELDPKKNNLLPRFARRIRAAKSK